MQDDRILLGSGFEPDGIAERSTPPGRDFRGAVFPNDITFTRKAAYITDSGRNVLCRVPRTPPAGFPPVPLAVTTVELTGPLPPVQAGEIALNGIRTLPGGRLVVVDSRDGLLYKVRRSDGRATPIPGQRPLRRRHQPLLPLPAPYALLTLTGG